MKRLIVTVLVVIASALTVPIARADEPTCAPGEEWQGEFGCVAVQLPEETNGRAIDCPDGSVGYMQDGRLDCPPAPVVAPSPAPVAPSAAAPVANDRARVAAPPVVAAPTVATIDVVALVRELFARIFGWIFG